MNNKLKFKNENTCIQLSTNRYEYDDWLNVEFNVIDNETQFTKIDSCLRYKELIELHNWFVSILNDDIEYNKMIFIEPNLSFKCSCWLDDKLLFSVILDSEVKPTFCAEFKYEQVFVLTKPDIIKYIKVITDWLCEYK